MSEDAPGDALGGVALHRWSDVGVDLPCHVGARMVEALAHDLDVDALAECQRGPGMTEPVEDQAR